MFLGRWFKEPNTNSEWHKKMGDGGLSSGLDGLRGVDYWRES